MYVILCKRNKEGEEWFLEGEDPPIYDNADNAQKNIAQLRAWENKKNPFWLYTLAQLTILNEED